MDYDEGSYDSSNEVVIKASIAILKGQWVKGSKVEVYSLKEELVLCADTVGMWQSLLVAQAFGRKVSLSTISCM